MTCFLSLTVIKVSLTLDLNYAILEPPRETLRASRRQVPHAEVVDELEDGTGVSDSGVEKNSDMTYTRQEKCLGKYGLQFCHSRACSEKRV